MSANVLRIAGTGPDVIGAKGRHCSRYTASGLLPHPGLAKLLLLAEVEPRWLPAAVAVVEPHVRSGESRRAAFRASLRVICPTVCATETGIAHRRLPDTGLATRTVS